MAEIDSSDVEDRMCAALAEIARGRPVVVVDDPAREGEGDLVFAAEFATPALLAFVVRHTSGFVCVALPGMECDRLELRPMYQPDGDRFGTAYQVTVDVVGTGTGISAADRARTIAALGSASTEAADLRRPGHVVPLRARDGGVLVRPGHTEAAVDLAMLAGVRPGSGLCEIVSSERPGHMAKGDELDRFAAEHGLALVLVADIASYRRRTEALVARTACTVLPGEEGGAVRAVGYRGLQDDAEHVAVVLGEIGGGDGMLMHVHRECGTASAIGPTGCDCGRRLSHARAVITGFGRGIVIHVRPPGPLRSCRLADAGRTEADLTVEVAAAIAADLGVRSVELFGADAATRRALRSRGIAAEGSFRPEVFRPEVAAPRSAFRRAASTGQ